MPTRIRATNANTMYRTLCDFGSGVGSGGDGPLKTEDRLILDDAVDWPLMFLKVRVDFKRVEFEEKEVTTN